MQIVVTDIEECMEALTENLISNLAHGSVRRITGNNSNEPAEVGYSAKAETRQVGRDSDGWDVPRTVIETAAQELPIRDFKTQENTSGQAHAHFGGGIEDNLRSVEHTGREEARDAQRAALNGLTSYPTSPSGTASHAQGVQTEVLVRTLDWRDGVQDLIPPYDVLLVADVVSPSAQCSLIFAHMQLCHDRSDK